ncbi:hypothetical protein AALP_AA8G320100 [Arabis alpina]|uniref:DUF4219 domain-containing protein n=1 Tax=Arabis alpina TaxID=50452 RepID=A0A087GAT9_ARAAL|nr:hypothetical protein AALP_AA8G320100 [Arabis alpina]
MNPAFGLTTAFSNVDSIPMLNGSNFSEWKEHLLLVLALMDLDISILEERPDAVKYVDETKHWDRSNRISMLIMQIRIPPQFRGIIPEDVRTAKEYLAAVEKCYAKNEVSEVGKVTGEFCATKKPNESVREYIMRKMSVAAKLKKLGMHIPDHLVADMLLDSLPSEYDQLRKTCSLLQENWSTHELISHCVQEEDRFKREKKERDRASRKVISGTKRKNLED